MKGHYPDCSINNVCGFICTCGGKVELREKPVMVELACPKCGETAPHLHTRGGWPIPIDKDGNALPGKYFPRSCVSTG